MTEFYLKKTRIFQKKTCRGECVCYFGYRQMHINIKVMYGNIDVHVSKYSKSHIQKVKESCTF